MAETGLVDERGRLVPELEKALKAIEDLEGTIQNREDVERVVSWEALHNLIDLGYVRECIYDPSQENYPNYFHEDYDHYERTTLGRAYFKIKARSRIQFAIVYVLPAVLAFLGAILGSYIAASS